MKFQFTADRRIDLSGQPVMFYATHRIEEAVTELTLLVDQDQTVDQLEERFADFIAAMRREEERCLIL